MKKYQPRVTISMRAAGINMFNLHGEISGKSHSENNVLGTLNMCELALTRSGKII